MRDYLASWTPKEISRLPQACRPGRLRDEQDIENMHATLVEEYRTTRATGEDLSLLQSSAPATGPMKSASARES